MDKKLVENIRKNMQSKSTEDLEQILNQNDKNEYSDEAFEAIRQLLEEHRKNPASQQVRSQNTREPSNIKTTNEETEKSETFTDYTTTYGTARMIAQFVSFVGWVVVAISGIILFVSLAKSSGSNGNIALMGIFPSCGGIISGLLLVMAGQMTRATVDTADNTGHMLVIMKSKKWK